MFTSVNCAHYGFVTLSCHEIGHQHSSFAIPNYRLLFEDLEDFFMQTTYGVHIVYTSKLSGQFSAIKSIDLNQSNETVQHPIN